MSKRWSVAFLLLATMAMSMLLAACGGDATTSTGSNSSSNSTPGSSSSSGGTDCQQGNATASGSTALAPLAKAVATAYQQKCQGANITVNLGGSKTGLNQVESGAVQIGNSDIPAADTQKDLVDHQVAIVIFTLVINDKITGVTSLTTDQVKKIYEGQATNWKDVGGNDLPIVVVSRPASSGTRATFQKYILGGTAEKVTGPSNLTSDSTGTIAQNVQQTAGAIGYITTGQAKKSNLKTINIDGNAPTFDLVKNNTYKFWNIEHMYTKGEATGVAKSYIAYMTSTDTSVQAAFKSLDFYSVKEMAADAVSAHAASK